MLLPPFLSFRHGERAAAARQAAASHGRSHASLPVASTMRWSEWRCQRRERATRDCSMLKVLTLARQGPQIRRTLTNVRAMTTLADQTKCRHVDGLPRMPGAVKPNTIARYRCTHGFEIPPGACDNDLRPGQRVPLHSRWRRHIQAR